MGSAQQLQRVASGGRGEMVKMDRAEMPKVEESSAFRFGFGSVDALYWCMLVLGVGVVRSREAYDGLNELAQIRQRVVLTLR